LHFLSRASRSVFFATRRRTTTGLDAEARASARSACTRDGRESRRARVEVCGDDRAIHDDDDDGTKRRCGV
jgi:hypothetical protein